MKESEVKDALFKLFSNWMRHQTVGVYPDGSTEFYAWDVQRYLDAMRRAAPSVDD